MHFSPQQVKHNQNITCNIFFNFANKLVTCDVMNCFYMFNIHMIDFENTLSPYSLNNEKPVKQLVKVMCTLTNTLFRYLQIIFLLSRVQVKFDFHPVVV